MTRKRWIKLAMSHPSMNRNAARELAEYITIQNSDISRVNKLAKEWHSKYRISPIRYIDRFKPVLLARLWETGTREETLRKVAFSIDTEKVY